MCTPLITNGAIRRGRIQHRFTRRHESADARVRRGIPILDLLSHPAHAPAGLPRRKSFSAVRQQVAEPAPHLKLFACAKGKNVVDIRNTGSPVIRLQRATETIASIRTAKKREGRFHVRFGGRHCT
jgi:hypothetical protein